jgi:hypothetical protein
MLRRATVHLCFSLGEAVGFSELLKARVPHWEATVVAAGGLLLKSAVSCLYDS